MHGETTHVLHLLVYKGFENPLRLWQVLYSTTDRWSIRTDKTYLDGYMLDAAKCIIRPK